MCACDWHRHQRRHHHQHHHQTPSPAKRPNGLSSEHIDTRASARARAQNCGSHEAHTRAYITGTITSQRNMLASQRVRARPAANNQPEHVLKGCMRCVRAMSWACFYFVVIGPNCPLPDCAQYKHGSKLRSHGGQTDMAWQTQTQQTSNYNLASAATRPYLFMHARDRTPCARACGPIKCRAHITFCII